MFDLNFNLKAKLKRGDSILNELDDDMVEVNQEIDWRDLKTKQFDYERAIGVVIAVEEYNTVLNEDGTTRFANI